jgi:hypothetical protein
MNGITISDRVSSLLHQPFGKGLEFCLQFFLLNLVVFRVRIFEFVNMKQVCGRTMKVVVPSSPNRSPAFAASWNGVFLEDGEAMPNEGWFNSLPGLQLSNQDLIDWFREEENLITTRIELFDEDTFSKVLWLSPDFGKIENLLATVNQSFTSSSASVPVSGPFSFARDTREITKNQKRRTTQITYMVKSRTISVVGGKRS